MNYLKPMNCVFPKHVPHTDWLVVRDAHLGPMKIWIGMRGTLFCDIDGTVADLSDRRQFLLTTPKDYASFEKGIPGDRPFPVIISAVDTLFSAGWTIIMCSGRRETQREATVTWLETNRVPYHALYMRHEFEYGADGKIVQTQKGKNKPDYRSDFIVKKELLDEARADGYYPDVVFDDRDQVVNMWRENGIPVVQVAEGDF